MSRVLYIETSPKKTGSRSIEVSKYFLDLYKEKYPEDLINIFDLSKEKIPDVNKDVVLAGYNIIKNGFYPIEEDNAWNRVKNFTNEFFSYDKYIIFSPLWIIGVPKKLKKLIDVLWETNYKFIYQFNNSNQKLIFSKPFVLILSRVNDYSGDFLYEDTDFKSIEFALENMGFKNIKKITIEANFNNNDNVKNNMIAKAKNQAELILREF